MNLKLGNTEAVPTGSEMSRADRKALKKKQADAAEKKKVVIEEDSDEESDDEDDELLNPQKAAVKRQTEKAAQAKVEVTRRERYVVMLTYIYRALMKIEKPPKRRLSRRIIRSATRKASRLYLCGIYWIQYR